MLETILVLIIAFMMFGAPLLGLIYLTWTIKPWKRTPKLEDRRWSNASIDAYYRTIGRIG